MKNSKWKKTDHLKSMDWDQFHTSRSFRCSLAPLPLPLPSALTLKASIPCTIFPLHPLLFSGYFQLRAWEIYGYTDLYWKTSKIQPPSMTSWSTTHYGKEAKEDNQVFWKKVSHKKQILYTAFWGQGCKWRLYWQCRREGTHVAWNAKNAAQHLKPKQNNCSWNLSSSNPKGSWIEANWKTFEEQAGCTCVYIYIIYYI